MYTLEWNVKNAVNRDVERQHLNKILADIKSTVQEVYAAGQDIKAGINDPYAAIKSAVTGGIQNGITVTYNDKNNKLNFSVNSFSITLDGAVKGSATVNGLSSVTINTTLGDLDLVEEAPYNSNVYWRGQGTWQAVPTQVMSLQYIAGGGYMVMDTEGNWYASTLQTASSERITITYPNAIDENGDFSDAVFDLAPVAYTTGGNLIKTAFDDYGRRIQEASADTDDLPEGITNLYFTEQRVYNAVKDQLVEGSNITIDADDVMQTLTISASGGGFVPYYVPANMSYEVPLYQQALFTLPIELEDGAMLVIDGALLEVN